MSKRECGECTLCCKLVPVNDSSLQKKAGERCRHQRHGKGCAIYSRRPISCRFWSCLWLQGAALRRPDRSHYVIDPMPDFFTVGHDDGTSEKVPCVQIWCDPNHPEAYRDPELRAWLDRAAKPALVRFDNTRGVAVFPPSITDGKGWVESDSRWSECEPEHSFDEIQEVLRGESQ